MPAISLTELQEQIAQREQELQALREQLQARQSHLTELTQRKEQLQSELRQVEEEIAALATTKASAPGQAAPAAPTVPSSPAPAARAEDQPQLGELIVTLLRESTDPLTGRQLLEEAQRRGYQFKSQDPLKAMANRLQVLKSKGVIRRAAGQYGFLLASARNGAKKKKSTTSQPAPANSQKTPAKHAKPEPSAKKSSVKESSSAEAGKSAKPVQHGEQLSLREAVTAVLMNSRKPLSTRELAEQIRATGYHSDSKNFVKVVGLMLSKMENVERVPDKGYRLKKN
jgi:DNA repair exonuclease SbcCD ATPase subunit